MGDLILIAALAQFIFWGWALAEILSFSSEQWASIGRSRTNWVFWVAVFGGLGALAYVAGPRRELAHAEPRPRSQAGR
jgi:hypothetical protein